MYTEKPLIFGHRGASADAPQNTLPAFELALAQDADGIELDVHRTKDGELVIVHDFEVDGTTDGTGTVTEMTVAEIKELDAGNYFDARFTGTPVPTLSEVFEALGKKLYVNVEIKSQSPQTDGVEQAVADCIVRHGMAERVIVSSFNPLTLKRFRPLMPDVPVAYLDSPEIPDMVRELVRDFPHELQHPHTEMVDAAYVQAARNAGRRINVWTANDMPRAVELVKLGVDGLVTDLPGAMRAALS